jgi:hypothetical protein
LNDVFGAEGASSGDLAIAFDDGDDMQAGQLRNVHEHEADGTASDDDDRVAGLSVRFLEAADYAGQRLGKSGVFEGNVAGHEQSILLDDPGRNGDKFGVGSVVEEQVVAEILLTSTAEIALVAWSGVKSNDAVAGAEILYARTDFVNNPGEFVPEWHRQGEHAGVITATVNLEVGATGKSSLDANDDFSRTSNWYRKALKAHIFATV